MTATQIAPNGILVPATMPYGRAKGSPVPSILHNQITNKFHCADCAHIGDTFGQMLGHRGSHHAKPGGKKRGRKPQVSPDDRLADAIARLDAIRDDLAERDGGKVDASWKARALDAEKQLKSLRRILGNGAES